VCRIGDGQSRPPVSERVLLLLGMTGVASDRRVLAAFLSLLVAAQAALGRVALVESHVEALLAGLVGRVDIVVAALVRALEALVGLAIPVVVASLAVRGLVARATVVELHRRFGRGGPGGHLEDHLLGSLDGPQGGQAESTHQRGTNQHHKKRFLHSHPPHQKS